MWMYYMCKQTVSVSFQVKQNVAYLIAYELHSYLSAVCCESLWDVVVLLEA